MAKVSAKNVGGSVFVTNDAGQKFKGTGFTSKYGSIGFHEGKKILETVSKLKPTMSGRLFMKKSQRGYMTLGSVLGNGRFRDRGVPETVLLKLFSNKTFLKTVEIGYKMSPLEEESLLRVYEPVVNTQSLQRQLSKIKGCVTLDKNGLTGVFIYDNIQVRLNADEVKRFQAYI